MEQYKRILENFKQAATEVFSLRGYKGTGLLSHPLIPL